MIRVAASHVPLCDSTIEPGLHIFDRLDFGFVWKQQHTINNCKQSCLLYIVLLSNVPCTWNLDTGMNTFPRPGYYFCYYHFHEVSYLTFQSNVSMAEYKPNQQ